MNNVFSADAPLVLVGCGHMGRALAVGWLNAGLLPEALIVVDPVANPEALPGVPGNNFYKTLDEVSLPCAVRAVILAVKPQVMDDILPQVAPLVGSETLVISVAAGVTLRQMERGLEVEAVLVRAMPNTPAAVGAGITGLTAAKGIKENHKALACRLLEATGQAVWIGSEDQMNAVTAVSGSGPAYVFHLVESMAAAGVKEGLPEDVAMQLARQTVIGAAQLMEQDRDVPADKLRQKVTSPGGTTAAALGVLMSENGLTALMYKAIKAARIRGEELAG